MISHLLKASILLLLLPLGIAVQAQNCNPDIDPPVAVCKSALTVAVPASSSTVSVPASALDDGSFDLCCGVSFLAARLADGPCDADNLPDPSASSLDFCCAEAGSTIDVQLFVTDCNGNSSSCTLSITVDDKTKPVMVCDELTFVSLPNGPFELNADLFDNGSYDNCCLTGFEIKKTVDGPCDADLLPDDFAPTVTFCCEEVGDTVQLILRASDCHNNVGQCNIMVIVEDKIKPICVAPANITLECADLNQDLSVYGNPQVSDNCCIADTVESINTSQFNLSCQNGVLSRKFTVTDCSGNNSSCTQTITVVNTQNYFIHFPDDILVYECDLPTNGFGQFQFLNYDCEVLDYSYADVTINNIPGLLYRIERSWTVINWCNGNPGAGVVTVPNPQPSNVPGDPSNLSGPIVSASGTPAPWNPSLVNETPGAPAPTDYSQFYNLNPIGYEYKQTIDVLLPDGTAVSGKVFADTLQNCMYDAGEEPLSDWTVSIVASPSGRQYTATPDVDGNYYQDLCPGDTSITLSLLAPFNYGQNCPSTHALTLIAGQNVSQDIPVALSADCPLMGVDITSPIIRPCNTGYYTVKACNFSVDSIQDVYVEVQLDNYLNFTNSEIPGATTGNNLWSFPVGTLHKGACTDFKIFFNVDCNAPTGATHCSEAHIYPDTLCPSSPFWSGASIAVNGYCDGDTVRMEIINEGTGNMTAPLNFIVVEDVIMYQSDLFQLNAGASKPFALPANGATWRLEAQQEPFHPYGGPESFTVEGCNNLNQPGLVTTLSFSSPNPFIDTDCQENVSSFDPNDKQASPSGYGPQHLVQANRNLDYKIRFQNTGTDTAFNVIVLDTLSGFLNPASVRPGASSHAYYFTILEGNVLRFHFENIMLPDSNVNEAASHGFVQFSVAQVEDNPLGAVIENTANIYFDFNDPVATNQVFHTIGEQFIVLKIDEAPGRAIVSLSPNPSADIAYFRLPDALTNAQFVLVDQNGKLIDQQNFSGNQYRFERKTLPSGIYFFSIRTAQGVYASGKIMLK